MRNLFLLGLLITMSAACLWGQQQRTFDWVRASDEIVQLDPMEFHAGRVYRPDQMVEICTSSLVPGSLSLWR